MLNYLNMLENANSVFIGTCQVKGHPSALLNAALYHRTVLLKSDTIMRSMAYLFISCDTVPSNQMIYYICVI